MFTKRINAMSAPVPRDLTARAVREGQGDSQPAAERNLESRAGHARAFACGRGLQPIARFAAGGGAEHSLAGGIQTGRQDMFSEVVVAFGTCLELPSVRPFAKLSFVVSLLSVAWAGAVTEVDPGGALQALPIKESPRFLGGSHAPRQPRTQICPSHPQSKGQGGVWPRWGDGGKA